MAGRRAHVMVPAFAVMFAYKATAEPAKHQGQGPGCAASNQQLAHLTLSKTAEIETK